MPSPAIPNNLGPTLLLVAALLLLPLGIGVPLLLVSLARVRTWQGEPAFPQLHNTLRRLQLARLRRGGLVSSLAGGRVSAS